MPEIWLSDEYKARRDACAVPEEITFETKTEIAAELIQQVVGSNIFPARWVGCDGSLGSSKEFLDSLLEGIYYFADVHANIKIWVEKPETYLSEYKGRGPRPKKLKTTIDSIPVSDIANNDAIPWHTVMLGNGAKGPIYARVKCLRVIECRDDLPAGECRLYVREYANGRIKYSLSNASADTPMETLNKVATMRWPIEQSFEDGKSYLGMEDYESRSWNAWHRHMLFVFLAQLFLLEIRMKFKKKLLY
jgi:SRSO17 transposase